MWQNVTTCFRKSEIDINEWIYLLEVCGYVLVSDNEDPMNRVLGIISDHNLEENTDGRFRYRR